MAGFLIVGLAGLLMLALASKIFPSGTGTIQQKIINRLRAAGYSARMARYWVAVSAFETGNWNSRLFVEDNNPFGMKHPSVRKTTSQGVGPSGFAKYETVDKGVEDIVLYMNWFNYPKDFATVQEMIGFMKMKGYFEEPLTYYLAGVESKINIT